MGTRCQDKAGAGWLPLYALHRYTHGPFRQGFGQKNPFFGGPNTREKPGTTQATATCLSPSTSMISSISRRVIIPSPSRSYISKAQLSFCSKVPLEVTDRAQMNSRKSMVPSPFLSKVRKACWANLEASP